MLRAANWLNEAIPEFQGFMADLQTPGCPGHGSARHQARFDKGLTDLLEENRFLGISQQQFLVGCTASRRLLFGGSWLDQAQEQGPC